MYSNISISQKYGGYTKQASMKHLQVFPTQKQFDKYIINIRFPASPSKYKCIDNNYYIHIKNTT